MSSFLSNKYLRYRGLLAEGKAIEGDLHCPGCGYNLRGLRYGRRCPECGLAIEPGGAWSADPLLSGTASERRAWQTGLWLASACVFVAMVSGVAIIVAGGPDAPRAAWWAHDVAGALNAVAWVIAVFLITPRSLIGRQPWMRQVRVVARVMTVLWIPACVLLDLAGLTTPGINGWVAAGRLTGAIGALSVIFILHHVAALAELENVARRLNAVAWLLPMLTLLMAATVAQIGWRSLLPASIALVPYSLVVLGWMWLMFSLSRSIAALAQHIRWSTIIARESVGREDRIKAKRRELDEAVKATIRPMPGDRGE